MCQLTSHQLSNVLDENEFINTIYTQHMSHGIRQVKVRKNALKVRHRKIYKCLDNDCGTQIHRALIIVDVKFLIDN